MTNIRLAIFVSEERGTLFAGVYMPAPNTVRMVTQYGIGVGNRKYINIISGDEQTRSKFADGI